MKANHITQQDDDLRMEVESKWQFEEWRKEIPYLNFKEEWNVKMIPHSGKAMVRFIVKVGDVRLSVYLDCYEKLGLDKPYWEIFPAKDGDTERFLINEADDLINAIDDSLKTAIYNKYLNSL